MPPAAPRSGLLEHAAELHRRQPAAELAVIPGTSHTQLRLIATQPTVLRVLELCGMGQVLSIYPSTAAALIT